MNWWVYALLAAAGVVALVRVYSALKRAHDLRGDDWDEQLVKNLRAQGGTAFRDYPIDFFFGLPTQAACESLASQLASDGCQVEFHAATTEGATGYTLCAHKAMRVSVPEMQAHSRRYRELADRAGGSYDGWVTEGAAHPAGERARLRPKALPRRL